MPDSTRDRYKAAAHAMQTGVAIVMEKDPGETQPKHLRVGVNSAMVDTSGLADLLIRKGIITEAEYVLAITEAMERERDAYQLRVRDLLGPGVRIG